jgi:hypothetical protein
MLAHQSGQTIKAFAHVYSRAVQEVALMSREAKHTAD